MATGIGNLPYVMPNVSPFDVITAQAENERMANIRAVADGSGIGDGAINTSDLADSSVSYPKLNISTFQIPTSTTNPGTVTHGASPSYPVTSPLYNFISGRTYLILFTVKRSNGNSPGVWQFNIQVNGFAINANSRVDGSLQQMPTAFGLYTPTTTGNFAARIEAIRLSGSSNLDVEDAKLIILPILS